MERQSQAFQTRQRPGSRRMLYLAAVRSIHLESSAFGAYYHRLVARGLKKGSALMAVMRKMLAVAAHLLRHEEESYDPSKVSAGAVGDEARRHQHWSGFRHISSPRSAGC
jgi:hypothetical protein